MQELIHAGELSRIFFFFGILVSMLQLNILLEIAFKKTIFLVNNNLL